jgi:hypothetical protein
MFPSLMKVDTFEGCVQFVRCIFGPKIRTKQLVEKQLLMVVRLLLS